ncbi:MAG TPA: hypothetical protein VEX62_10035, partial [Candidatus Limnocylindrales bacterium]|nr:hypothetical protein [Candidatus Limnocylindrales bacterium]
MRVELLATADCPHLHLAEDEVRTALEHLNGANPQFDLVYVSDLDNAAGLGFHGSPTVRIDGLDVVAVAPGDPINLGCRLYPQPDGRMAAVLPAQTIVAEVERRRAVEAQERAAQPSLRSLPARVSRGFFLWSSRRRSLARMATAVPFTRSMVRRFVAGDRLDDALVALERLRDQGLTWTVDVLGESVSSREMALASADRYIATLD